MRILQEWVLAVKAGLAMGYVYDAEGMPIAQAKVSLAPKDYNPLSIESDSNDIAVGETDSKGYYEIELTQRVDEMVLFAEGAGAFQKGFQAYRKLKDLPELLHEISLDTLIAEKPISLEIQLSNGLPENSFVYLPGTKKKMGITIHDSIVRFEVPRAVIDIESFNVDSQAVIEAGPRIESLDTRIDEDNDTLQIEKIFLPSPKKSTAR